MTRPGTTSSERLARLLNLVPYLLARPGVEVAQAAADLGATEAQVRDDLELLWVCGLPGYGPGDLIDMAFDGDRVTITYDAGIDRPLRLRPDEATALVVALRMLAETPGIAQRDAILRALAKIESAAGDVADAPIAVQSPDGGSADDRLATVRAAVERGRALRITYYTATRDESTERVIDPMRVIVVADRSYVEAWCRRAGAVRLFKIDRIDALNELDEPAAPPPQAQSTVVDEQVFRPSQELPTITIRIGRGDRWITEYYPVETVDEITPEEWLVTLRVSDLDWARRFVLGLGPGVDVIAPAELAESVRGAVLEALAAYA
ncbi:MAG: YafY family transcriptional regulator [Hamadaea sp.]|uniref:helix-turn-helix transcriptional regulator n=1 Tax=Hamadaea sp. TaxID=2024425 RepID=UPI001839F313|nr:YafY family protein [Hamadaea sp.]NUR73083.1 YafY family transcriptional regulator [Hamadaea sp.]NUT18313.1 YafY family transcriptional regulator [Hamadaea sp.]